MHEVGQDGLGAVLPQHGGDLAAVIGPMVDHVLQGLPQGISVDAELERLVFESAVEIGLRQAANKSQKPGLEFDPSARAGRERR